jgi:hypothetical protein
VPIWLESVDFEATLQLVEVYANVTFFMHTLCYPFLTNGPANQTAGPIGAHSDSNDSV